MYKHGVSLEEAGGFSITEPPALLALHTCSFSPAVPFKDLVLLYEYRVWYSVWGWW